VAMGSSPESPGRKVCKIFLVYCIASLFYYVSCPYVIYYPTAMARYSPFVLKMPLNPKQTNKFRSAGRHLLVVPRFERDTRPSHLYPLWSNNVELALRRPARLYRALEAACAAYASFSLSLLPNRKPYLTY